MEKSPSTKKGCVTGCLVVFMVFVVIGIGIAIFGGGSSQQGAPSEPTASSSSNEHDTSSTPIVGDEYWFRIHPLCLDDYHAFDALADANDKHDREGVAQLLMEHGVDIGSGTHVRILNVDVLRSDVDVRVTSTNSDHYGEEIYCYIPQDSNGQSMFDEALQHL